MKLAAAPATVASIGVTSTSTPEGWTTGQIVGIAALAWLIVWVLPAAATAWRADKDGFGLWLALLLSLVFGWPLVLLVVFVFGDRSPLLRALRGGHSR